MGIHCNLEISMYNNYVENTSFDSVSHWAKIMQKVLYSCRKHCRLAIDEPLIETKKTAYSQYDC